jgi:hypothetical protein
LGSAGKLADLIVVDGDPLAEINVLTEPARIALVIGVLGQATAVGTLWPQIRDKSRAGSLASTLISLPAVVPTLDSVWHTMEILSGTGTQSNQTLSSTAETREC